jgi:phage head maturation protease
MRNPGQYPIGGSGLTAVRGVHAARLAASGAAEPLILSGSLAAYDPAESGRDADGIPVVLQAGCFSGSLRKDLRLTFNFGSEHIFGRVSAGTLRLWETPEELRFECLAPPTSWFDALLVSMQRGDVSGAGVDARIVTSRLERRRGQQVKIVSKGELMGIAICSFAKYEAGLQINNQQKQEKIAASYDKKFLAKLGIANRLYLRARQRLHRDG